LSTGTENYLLEKYGPLLSIVHLANLLDRSPDGLRLSLQQDGDLSRKFQSARKKIGRRVYFITERVAAIIDDDN
jgi:hypothetical protein